MSTVVETAPASLYWTVNPATGDVVNKRDAWTDDEADAALARAHEAYQTWRTTPVEERVALFRRMVDVIGAHAEDYGRLDAEEMGKPLAAATGEVAIPQRMFAYFADNGPKFLAAKEAQVAGARRAYTKLAPTGVTLAIEPWNVAVYQAMRAAVPNLMLGNTILMKPSPVTVNSSMLFDDWFREAGFPEGVYQTALLTNDQVSAYIADKRVRSVTFTGSDRTGSIIAKQAGEHIKPVVLELGGSDPFVVLDSADVQKAARLAAGARLMNAGQICVSPKRVIVTEKVADEFIATYSAVFSAQKVGDPFDPTTTVGPLSTIAAADLLQEQYQDALDKGAKVVVPGGRVDGPGAFFTPAVVTGITPDMRIYSEEAFGPLGMIYVVPNADAAVALANDTKYGLTGTVYGEDLDEATRVAEAIDSGGIGINTYFGAPIEVPFGGTKSSGVGRELGESGMEPYANVKSYTIG
ncbi:aldehyde dehydrogenase family protein [Rathayibacter sp. CAU 1779]